MLLVGWAGFLQDVEWSIGWYLLVVGRFQLPANASKMRCLLSGELIHLVRPHLDGFLLRHLDIH